MITIKVLNLSTPGKYHRRRSGSQPPTFFLAAYLFFLAADFFLKSHIENLIIMELPRTPTFWEIWKIKVKIRKLKFIRIRLTPPPLPPLDRRIRIFMISDFHLCFACYFGCLDDPSPPPLFKIMLRASILIETRCT